MRKLSSSRPPWLGRLLSRLIVGDGAESLRGDLDESFERRVAEHGDSLSNKAAYVADVTLSVAHWWWSAIRGARYEAIGDDWRFGARMLMKHPAFTIISAASLAVGIGATTTVFGLVNAVLLRPLPVRDPATLVSIEKPQPNSSGIHVISYPAYLDYRARADVFSDLAAWTEATIGIELDGQAEQTYGMLVSGNYFSALGVRPALGRLLSNEEGDQPIAVLSFTFWERRFASDSSVVGRVVELNGQRYTIIGVAPKGFTSTYNVFAPALYAPLLMEGQLLSRPQALSSRGWNNLKLTGRLKPGVTRDQAQAALNVIDRQLEQAYPDREQTSRHANGGIRVVPVGSYPWDIRVGLLGGAALLLAIVGSVLLIACANVAGMLLARATARRREIAVRLALGATRGRLIRQLLTESCLLFLVAGAAGLVLTWWLTRLITTFPVPVALPFALEANVDWRVFGFTLFVALLTGIVFGLAPALEAARVDLHAAMTDGASSHGFKRSRVRQAFVVAQIALSLVLLIGAGLFTRALDYSHTIYPGRHPETVLTARLDPEPLGYKLEQTRELYRRLTERVASLPGVEAVSMADEVQIGGGYATTDLVVQDAPDAGKLSTETSAVGPGYFDTLDINLISGREFTHDDRETSARVVIISETTARRFWPAASPLGRRVRIGGSEQWAEVIGVVEDGPHRELGRATAPFVYAPFLQKGSGRDWNAILLLRFRGDKASILTAVRQEARTIDPRLPLQTPMTLMEAVETVTLPWRVAGIVASVFGFIGLALATLGIYGLVAYTVNQRTHEIGVRVALGADPGDIRGLVIGQGLKLALLGVAIGAAIAFGVTRALASFLFGVSASDPMTYVGQSLLLVVVALAASYFPARRATMTDPLVALRHE